MAVCDALVDVGASLVECTFIRTHNILVFVNVVQLFDFVYLAAEPYFTFCYEDNLAHFVQLNRKWAAHWPKDRLQIGQQINHELPVYAIFHWKEASINPFGAKLRYVLLFNKEEDSECLDEFCK